MSGLICRASFACLLFLIPHFVFAQISITEIMYDLPSYDGGGEWVEIKNTGNSPVNIILGNKNEAWRFSDGSQHTLSMRGQGSILNPGEYAVIVDNSLVFMKNHPSFSGMILDSSFSLNNIWGDVSLLSGKNGSVMSRVQYSSSQGGSGDGNSLQLQSDGSWISAIPTPGSDNSSFPIIKSALEKNTENNLDSSHYSALPTSSEKGRSISLGAGRNRVGAVGSPMEFRAETTIDKNRYDSFIWNFGDGTQGGGNIVSHVYQYPGEYIVVLNASFRGGEEGISRVPVKIVEPNLSISYADNQRIEILNNSDYEISLFGRAIVFGEKFFSFPKDTLIGKRQQLSFSNTITGLSPLNENQVFIAVLGLAEQPSFMFKIEEERIKRIEYIRKQLLDLQQRVNNFGSNL